MNFTDEQKDCIFQTLDKIKGDPDSYRQILIITIAKDGEFSCCQCKPDDASIQETLGVYRTMVLKIEKLIESYLS